MGEMIIYVGRELLKLQQILQPEGGTSSQLTLRVYNILTLSGLARPTYNSPKVQLICSMLPARMGNEYIVVTLDGLPVPDSSSTQGKCNKLAAR